MTGAPLRAGLGCRGDIRSEVRWAAAIIVPILSIAFVMLFVLPDSNSRWFSWPVRPRLSAMTLGATYLLGSFYFTTVLFARRWREVQVGFLAVSTFAALLGIATVLHWDKFSHNLFSFWLWAFLYFTLPFVLPFLWWRGMQSAERVPPSEVRVLLPSPLRVLLALVLLPGLLIAAMLFLTPGLMIDVWPWALTPLTARVICAQFALYGVLGVQFITHPDWESMRLVLKWQLFTPLLYPIAIAVSWDDLMFERPMTWAYLANGMVVFVFGVPVLYAYMESRWRKSHRQSQN